MQPHLHLSRHIPVNGCSLAPVVFDEGPEELIKESAGQRAGRASSPVQGGLCGTRYRGVYRLLMKGLVLC